MMRRRTLYAGGELLTETQMCERLAINSEILRAAVCDGRMYWIEGAHGVRWYPSFFADRPQDRCDIEKVTLALNPLLDTTKWAFFTTPKYSLDGQTPIEALRHGAVAQVLRAAGEFVERNLGRRPAE